MLHLDKSLFLTRLEKLSNFKLFFPMIWLNFRPEFDLKYQIKNNLYIKFPNFDWILARIWLSHSLNFNFIVMIFFYFFILKNHICRIFKNPHFGKIWKTETSSNFEKSSFFVEFWKIIIFVKIYKLTEKKNFLILAEFRPEFDPK